MNDEINMRLFRAASRGSLGHVLLAIEAGANLKACDYNNHTALHIARSRNHVHLANALVKLGADCSLAESLDPIRPRSCARSAAIARKAPCRPPSEHSEAIANAEAALISNFPASAASAMMRGQHAPALTRPSVSVAFLEVAGYPALRGTADPPALCRVLARLFRALDALAARHGVERVDAFDGCYVAAANYSARQPADHAVRLARFAAATVAAAAAAGIPADPRRPELGPLALLGGMHCGAVCGSVVGAHGGCKHTLHGDAVNVASRMQSHGAAGAVQCSAAAAALIEAQGGRAAGLRVAAREGGVDVKGLGRMRTAWVSVTASSSHQGDVPVCFAGPGPVCRDADNSDMAAGSAAACPCGPETHCRRDGRPAAMSESAVPAASAKADARGEAGKRTPNGGVRVL